MKIVLRGIGLILAVAALGLWAFVGAVILVAGITLGGAVAFMIFGALAVFCVRCGMWLWSERPFWKEGKRLAEIAAVIAAFLMVGIVAQLEKVTSGTSRMTIQFLGIAAVASIYFIFRRLPASSTPDERRG